MGLRSMHRRILIRGLSIALGLVGLALAAAIVLPLVVDANRYRGLIQTKAEEALGRKVTLGPMALSVLPTFGIKVDALEVEGLLRARSLTVGVRLLPLLFGGSVDVSKLVLTGPEITAARGADGRWNFESATGPAKAPVGPGSSPPAPGPAGRAFSLSRLLITGGVLHLRDAGGRSGSPLALDFGVELDASVKGSAAGNLEAAFDGALKGDRMLLDLRGSVARAAPPGSTRFDITVDSADIDVARAKDLTTAAGLTWPVPEGLLRSRSLHLGGRLQGSLEGGGLSALTLTDLVVQDADVYLARDRRGRWNFAPLMEDHRPAEGYSGAPAGATLRMKNLRVGGAKVTLHDEAAGAGAPVDLTLKELLLVVSEFERDRPLELQLQASLEPGGGSIAVSGKIPLTVSGTIDASADLERLDARAISAYLKSVTDLDAESGAVTAHIKMKGTYPQEVTAAGSLALDRVKTSAAQPITATADFDITASDSLARIGIKSFDLKLRGSRVGLRGSIARAGDSTLVDLDLPACSIDAADLMGLAALAGVKSPIEVSSSRPVRIQARLKGDIAHRQSLDLSGSLEVSEFSFRLPIMDKPMEQIRGRLAVRGNGFDVTAFSGVIGRSDVGGELSVTDLESPRATFSLTSRHADFWELMSFLRQAPSAAGSPGTAAPPDAGGGLLSRLTARGTLAIGEGSFDTLTFTDLNSKVGLQGRVLELDPVAMKLYGGSIDGSARMEIDQTPPVYTVRLTASGIDTDGLLTANLQMKGMLSGALSGRFSVASSGSTRDAAVRNARGSGELRIEKGKVGAVNVLKVLSRASDLMGETSLKQVSGKLAKEGTEFSSLTGSLEVAGGRIKSSDLLLKTPDLELKDDGSLDLLGGTIDIAGQIVFSETMSQAMVQERSKAVDYFWDTDLGRVSLPLTMTGPIASPMPSIDWGVAGGKLVRRKTEDALRDRLKQAGLGGLLGDRGGKPPERQPGPRESGSSRSEEPAAGALAVNIEEKGFSGNALMPDLKIRGTLAGTTITEAKVRIVDQNGSVVHEQSLMEKVNKYYTTHDRSVPAAINFRVEVDGKRLLTVRGDLQVTISLSDASGASASKNVSVSR